MKKKLGRPSTGRTKKVRMSYVTDDVHKFYAEIGKGNYSKGLQMVKEKLEELNK
jgi:hypothetical protein